MKKTILISSFLIILSLPILIVINCGDDTGNEQPPTEMCVWIADEYNNAVRRFSIDGSEELGGLYETLDDPRSVSVDKHDSSAWIADRYNGRILKIKENGDVIFTSEFYQYTRVNWVVCDSSDGSCWGCVRDDGYVVKLDVNGNELGRATNMGFPFFCCLDESGNCWVADERVNKVYLILKDLNGNRNINEVALLTIDAPGVGIITPDGEGGIFVSLEDTNEIKHFNDAGETTSTISGFEEISAIWFNTTSRRLWAGDGDTLRLLDGDAIGNVDIADVEIASINGFGSIDYIQISSYDDTTWVSDKGLDSVHIIDQNCMERLNKIEGFFDPFGISIRDEVVER